MTQTLLVVVLFVGAMALLPWLLRRVQQRQGAVGAGGAASRVLAQVAVGPQQRVVTVEVNAEGQRAVLVLGVTAQQIQCLHVMPAANAAPGAAPSFAGEMAAAQQALPHKDAHA